jgi:hypothetical protein
MYLDLNLCNMKIPTKPKYIPPESGQDITGYVNINYGTRSHLRVIRTKSNFFEAGEYYVISCSDNKVVFSRPRIDKRQIVHKASSKRCGWVSFGVKSDIPPGRYYFDKDDSTIDKAVVYFDKTK